MPRAESIGEVIEVNRRNHAAYAEGLAGLHGVKLVGYDDTERNNRQYVVVEVDEVATGLSRDALVRVLHAENVFARKYFWPGVHRMEPYRSLFPHAGLLLPETERIAARGGVLPTGTAISVDDVGVICSLIRAALGDSARVGERVRTLPQG